MGKMKERVAMRDMRTGLRVLWRVSRRFLDIIFIRMRDEVGRLSAQTVLETTPLRPGVPSAGLVDGDLVHEQVRLFEPG